MSSSLPMLLWSNAHFFSAHAQVLAWYISLHQLTARVLPALSDALAAQHARVIIPKISKRRYLSSSVMDMKRSCIRQIAVPKSGLSTNMGAHSGEMGIIRVVSLVLQSSTVGSRTNVWA